MTNDPGAATTATGSSPVPDAAALRRAFDRATAGTVGVEDEVMLLDPDTLELAPVARELLDSLPADGSFKLEFPASQLELIPPVSDNVPALMERLLDLRRQAAAAASASGLAVPAAAAVHPFSPASGELNRMPRYRDTMEQYGIVARRQLVCAFQVHVAIGDAERALAVYNAARGYLPLVAALAAAGPIYEGEDTGLASMRPVICRLLPRQGVPPPVHSWEELAAAYRWGARSGTFTRPASWWWELRPHPRWGTLEFRVPDGQSDVTAAGAVAAVIQALVRWLATQHAAGERLPVAGTWQIEENRWSACSHGVEGSMADLLTGESRPTRELLHELLETLAPVAAERGAAPALEHAHRLAERNGAIVQREVFAGAGPRGLAGWLAARFCTPGAG